MSGSCSTRVCWRKLPNFRVTGIALAQLHEGAALVRLAQRGGRKPARLRPARPDLKRPNKTDLVFLEDSPDYCERNLTLVKFVSSNFSSNKINFYPFLFYFIFGNTKMSQFLILNILMLFFYTFLTYLYSF